MHIWVYLRAWGPVGEQSLGLQDGHLRLPRGGQEQEQERLQQLARLERALRMGRQTECGEESQKTQNERKATPQEEERNTKAIIINAQPRT